MVHLKFKIYLLKFSMDCLFCKIINKEIPSSIVYEDDNVIAFLDINPTNFGHTLVVPKQHYNTFLETPDDVLCGLMSIVKKIGNAILALPDVDAINFLVNNGQTAGQLIFHLHIHIVPRMKNDGFKHWKRTPYKNDEQMKLTAEMIKANIK